MGWQPNLPSRAMYGIMAGGTEMLRYLIAIVVVLAACGLRPGGKPAEMFPESGEARGWKRTAQTRTFEAGNLWEYINGDAERYVRAGVDRALTTDYRYQNRVDGVAEVYVMGGPEGARTVLESQSAEGSQPVNIGNAARHYGASLIFRKGRYLVRLVAYEEAPEVGKALEELARVIEGKLGQ